MPSPILTGSIRATRFWMTPSASSRWMRFQHGVDDSPTRLPISATDNDASFCSTARILRSMASMLGNSSNEDEVNCRSALIGINFLFRHGYCLYRVKYSIFKSRDTFLRDYFPTLYEEFRHVDRCRVIVAPRLCRCGFGRLRLGRGPRHG